MRRTLVTVLLLISCAPCFEAQAGNENDRNAQDTHQNTTESLEPIVNNVMKKVARELYPVLEGILENQKVDSKCVNSLIKVLRGMQKLDFWAYSFMRSSGGLGPMLEGSATDLGMYDACINAKANDDNGDVMFTGRYCTLFILVENEYLQRLLLQGMHNYKELSDYVHGDANLYFNYIRVLQRGRIGVCVPSTCHGGDIENIILGLGEKYGIQPSVPACRAKDEDPYLTPFQVLVIVIIVLLVLLCSVAGLMESPAEKSNEIQQSCALNVLGCFSIKRNWATVFKTIINPQTSYLSCIHGIRALSCIYVLCGHVYMTVDPFTIHYPMQVLRWLRHDITLVPIYMGFYVVDTFFCITGLIAYRALKLKFSEKKVPSTATIISMALLRRWIRLIVPCMAVIAFFFLWPVFVSGPTKDLVVDHLIDGCAKNWWTIPAMIGNFYQMHHQCLLHLWYIGVDFQIMLLLLFPLILVVKRESRRTGAIILSVMAVLSVVFVFTVTFVSELPPFLLPLPLYLAKLPELVLKIYFNPFSHVVSSVMGIFFGYLIERHREDRSSIPSRTRMNQLWTGLTIFCVVYYFLPFYWQTGGEAFTVWSALYSAFSRGLWSMGVGWVIFACATGHGGIVNNILSSTVLLPLSRISLSFYLVHILVVATRVVQQRGLVEAQHYLVMKHALSDIAISFFFALVLFCLVEAPVTNLDKLVFNSIGRSRSEDKKLPKEQSLDTIIVKESNAALKDRL